VHGFYRLLVKVKTWMVNFSKVWNFGKVYILGFDKTFGYATAHPKVNRLSDPPIRGQVEFVPGTDDACVPPSRKLG